MPPSRFQWSRPVTGLSIALCLVFAMLMLYMPFQFQAQPLRFLYPYLRWFGVAYGLAGTLLLLDAARVDLPAWTGRVGRALFLIALVLQGYLAAHLPGIVLGRYVYTFLVTVVLLSAWRPQREELVFHGFYVVLSLCIGLFMVFRPQWFPAWVFGSLPGGLGPFFIGAGLIQGAALLLPARFGVRTWLPLLLAALPLLWFSWAWIRVNNWMGVSVYLTMGAMALIRALYLLFPVRVTLKGLRLRILMSGIMMTVLPLTILGAISIYGAQVMDADATYHSLSILALEVERTVEHAVAQTAVANLDLSRLGADAAKARGLTEDSVTVGRLFTAPGEVREAGPRIWTEEQFSADGQRLLAATIERPDLGLTITVSQPTRLAYEQAQSLALIALLVTALVAAVSIFVQRFLAVHLTRHLTEVRDVAAAIGAHRYAARAAVPDGRDDEVTDLARTINSVAQTLGDYSRRLDRLMAITDTALAHLSLTNLIDELLARIREALAGDTAVILLLTKDGKELLPTGSIGLEIEVLQSVRVPMGEGFAGRIALERQPLIVEHVAEFPVVSAYLRERVRSLVGAPLLVGDRVIGVVHVGSCTPRHFTADEAQLLQMAADRIALAIDHARLYGAEVTARRELEAKRREIEQLNAGLERRVAERTAELSTANRELEAFAYSVSHDLRSPIRSINGFSQILMEDYAGQLDPQGRDYLDRICAATMKMERLIVAMLGLSRVSRVDLSPQVVDLSALARSVAADLKRQEPERLVEVRVEPGLRAEADPSLMRILLENTLTNAFKFTRPVKGARVEVGQELYEGERVLFVRDNGIGFDMAYADKLFRPFQRLHAAKEFEGTGIGLATVQRIILRHGGRIWAESRPGAGAVFRFTLPG